MNEKKGLIKKLSDSRPMMFISESIRNKLIFWFLILSLIPLIILGVIAYNRSSIALMANASKNLQALESARADTVKKYFEELYNDINALNDTVKTLRAKAFNQLASIQQLKKRLIESYFNERMNDVKILSDMPVIAESLLAFDKVGNQIGTPAWKGVEQKYGPFLAKYSESQGYYDAYLVTEKGDIVYTVAQESDLGQNLKDGELKDTSAGKAFQGGLKGVTFQDFEAYGPAYGDIAAFIAAPVYLKDSLIGIVMVQVSVDQINFVMQERTGLGQSGESYMVGPDAMFRSDSIHIEESTVMNPAFIVDTKGTDEALEGKSGQGVTVNFRGEYVLSSWTPVKIHENLTWAMLGEIDVIEAFVPKDEEDKDFFTRHKERYGYENLSLINPDGFLFFTVVRGEDYRTNLLTGPYKDSNLGRLVAKVLETKEPGMADFEVYEPIGKKQAAFIALPVLSENREVEAIVAAQLSVEQINTVMLDRTGLSEKTETYLIGPDKKFRSESMFVKDLGVKSAVMNPAVSITTTAAQDALSGREGTGVIKDYRGIRVLSSWSSIPVSPATQVNPQGIRWGVIAQTDYEEVKSPANKMLFGGFILFLAAIVVVSFGAWRLSQGLTKQVNHITDLFGEIGMGNFKARTPVDTSDELGAMAISLNAMLDNTLSLIQTSEERDKMQRSVMKLLTEISGLAEGNLMARAEVTEDFTGAIADSFNDMAEQLGRVVQNVKDVTLQVSSTSQEVRTSTENLAETSEMQANQVTEAIAAINEMAASIQQVAENASQCSHVSEESKKHANEGAKIVRDTNAAMESIRDHVQETARAIKRLGESSQEVGNIVQLIGDIADRTSILALNASIQAAMAGEAGRGFAVVAEEVQRLAERSTNATQQIDTLIKNIQGEINEAGTSMEESIQRVVDGSRLADNAHAKLNEIETITTRLGELIQSISMASKQQARGSENIARTMQEVGEISSQTSAASRQTAVSMKNLAEMSDQMNESVSVFKVTEEKED